MKVSITTDELIKELKSRGYGCIYKTMSYALNKASDYDVEYEFTSRGLECDCDYSRYDVGDVLEEDLDLEPDDINLALKLIGDVKLGGEEWLLTEKLRRILTLY